MYLSYFGENILYFLLAQERRHQYWKTSNEKYVGIYLFFLICLHIFRDFLSFSSSLLYVFWFLRSPSQWVEDYSLDKKITFTGYWITFINHQREIVVCIVLHSMWMSGVRRKKWFLCFEQIWACSSQDQGHSNWCVMCGVSGGLSGSGGPLGIEEVMKFTQYCCNISLPSCWELLLPKKNVDFMFCHTRELNKTHG